MRRCAIKPLHYKGTCAIIRLDSYNILCFSMGAGYVYYLYFS